jgi:hypothetical protein
MSASVEHDSLTSTDPTWPDVAHDGRAAALEVTVIWGQHSVLHMAHASPPRPFYVGDAAPEAGVDPIDFVIGCEAIGYERLPIAICDGDTGSGSSSAAVVIAPGAELVLALGGRTWTLDMLAAEGRLRPYPEIEGALQCSLPIGASARLQHGAFTFVVAVSPETARTGVGAAALGLDRKAMRWTFGSFGVHLAVLFLFQLLPPHSSALSLSEYGRETRLPDFIRLQIEQEELAPTFLDPEPGDNGGKGGQPERGEVGKAGDKREKETKRRLAVKGPEDNPDPALPREQLERDARSAWMIEALHKAAAEQSGPSSIYGRDQALGADPESALGALLGDRIGASFGLNGGGMIGTGRHGGGAALGTLGLRGLGTIGGHGGDRGTGTGYGSPGSMREHKPRGPQIIGEKPQIRGALSKEAIRRVVHRHLNEVRYCYEEGLRARPDLQGRVGVRFVVAPDGAVKIAARASSDLGDARVEQCIVDAVRRWTFPAPDGGGLVIVTYPFSLQRVGG